MINLGESHNSNDDRDNYFGREKEIMGNREKVLEESFELALVNDMNYFG